MEVIKEVVPTTEFGGFVSSILDLHEHLKEEEGLLRRRLKDDPYNKELEFLLLVNLETQTGIGHILRDAGFRRVQSMSSEEVDEYRRSKVMDVEVEMGFLQLDLARFQKRLKELEVKNGSLQNDYYEATGDKKDAVYGEIRQNDNEIASCKRNIAACEQDIARLESKRKRMIALSDEEIKREFFDSHKMYQDYDELAKRDGDLLDESQIARRNLEKIVADISQDVKKANALASVLADYNEAVEGRRKISVTWPDSSYLPHDFYEKVSKKGLFDYTQTPRRLKNPQEVYEVASNLSGTYTSNVERLKGKLDLILVLIGTEKSGEVSKELLEALGKLLSVDDSLFDKADYKELEALALQKENVQNKKGLFAAFERFSGKQESELGDISTKIREVKKRIYPRIYGSLANTSFDYYGVNIPDFTLSYVPVHYRKEEAQRLVAELKEKLEGKVTKVDEFVESMQKQADNFAYFDKNAEKRVATCREAFFEFIKEHVQASSVSLDPTDESKYGQRVIISDPYGEQNKNVTIAMPSVFYTNPGEVLTHDVKDLTKAGKINDLEEKGLEKAEEASKKAQEEVIAVNEAMAQNSGSGGNSTVGKSIEEAYQEYIEAEKRRQEEQLEVLVEEEPVDSSELAQSIGAHK